MTQTPGVPEPLTPVSAFAHRIRELRTARGWSARELGERCTAAGLPWDRSIVSNVEHGRRGSVTVAEASILAYVLGVPPILLLYPVGLVDEVEVMPGRVLPTWAAAQWFTGEKPLPSRGQDGRWGVAPGDFEAWQTGAAPVDLFREHDRLVAEWKSGKAVADGARKAAECDADENERQAHLRQAAQGDKRAEHAETQLVWTRGHMRRSGLTPPLLLGDLARVDEQEPRTRLPWLDEQEGADRG